MKTTSKFFGIILFLFGMLCFSGCSSSDDDGDSYVEDAWGDPGTSASNFNPSYSDYIGTDQFTDDYNNFLYLMIMGQSYKDWTFYAWYDIEKGPFGIDEAYDEDLDFLFELEGEINDLYDKGKESIERLDQMEILFTETPETSTRGAFGVLQKCAAFFGVLKSTGEEARKTALGVLAQNPDEAETLFNAMNPKFHYGEDNFAKWIQNLNDGKYDNHGNTIYRELYNRSQEKSVDNAIGRGFYEYAIDNKLTPNDRAANALPKVWKAGVDFATSIPSGVIYGKGFKPSNLVDAYDGNKAAQDAVKIGVATFGAKQTAKAVINLGSKDKSGTEAERKAREKELEEATKAYLNDIQNKAADAKSQTNVEVVDNDKSSQATSVVVKNNENGRINVSVGTTKVPIGLDDDSNVTVTGVDDKGDKFTKSVNAKKGETTKVNGSSDEKEKIGDEEPYFEVDNNPLVFSSEPKGAQTVTVKTNLKLRVKKDPKYDWLTVKRNKNIITVSATKNTGDERKASFKIEFSKNGETVYDAITVKVEQKAFQDIVSDDLGFIDFVKYVRVKFTSTVQYDLHATNGESASNEQWHSRNFNYTIGTIGAETTTNVSCSGNTATVTMTSTAYDDISNKINVPGDFEVNKGISNLTLVIENINDIKNARIKSIEGKGEWSKSYVGDLNQKQEGELKASDIPIKETSSNKWSFIGEKKNGAVISKWVYKETYTPHYYNNPNLTKVKTYTWTGQDDYKIEVYLVDEVPVYSIYATRK